MRQLPAVPGQLGVFTTGQAHAAGWTRSALAAAVGSGRLRRIHRAVYAPAAEGPSPNREMVELAQTAVAASLGARTCVVSHLGAAIVHDLPAWAPAPRACVSVYDRSRLALSGVHVHRCAVDAADRPARVTAVARTVTDIAREFGVEAGLVTADAALRSRRTRLSELHAAAERPIGWRGFGRVAQLVRLVDPNAESPLESRSRWKFRGLGVTAPLSQVDLFTTEAEFLGRADFFWPEGVVGEVDGSSKYTDQRALRREKWRQERMERVDLQIVRWGAVDLDRFESVARLIEIKRARARASAGPRRWMLAAPPDTYGA